MTQREKMGRGNTFDRRARARAQSFSLARTHVNTIRGELLSPLDQATPSRQEALL